MLWIPYCKLQGMCGSLWTTKHVRLWLQAMILGEEGLHVVKSFTCDIDILESAKKAHFWFCWAGPWSNGMQPAHCRAAKWWAFEAENQDLPWKDWVEQKKMKKSNLEALPFGPWNSEANAKFVAANLWSTNSLTRDQGRGSFEVLLTFFTFRLGTIHTEGWQVQMQFKTPDISVPLGCFQAICQTLPNKMYVQSMQWKP